MARIAKPYNADDDFSDEPQQTLRLSDASSPYPASEQLKSLIAFPHLARQILQLGDVDTIAGDDQHVRVILKAVMNLTGNETLIDGIKRVKDASGRDTELRDAADELRKPGVIEALVHNAPTQEKAITEIRTWMMHQLQPETPENMILLGQTLAGLTAEPTPVTCAHPDPADEWQPFPTHSFPTVVRHFILETAASTCVDPAMVALPALLVLATAIGCTRTAKVKSDFQVFPILWATIIAESGTRKSPALHAALAIAWAEQEKNHKAYFNAKIEHKKDSAEIAATENAHPGTSEHLEKPQYRHIVTSDATTEKVGEMLAKSTRGLLVARDELAGLFGAIGQYKGGKGHDQQKILEWYEGRPQKVDRKKDPDPLFIPRAAVWIIGCMQPETFWETHRGRNERDGMLSRFLLCKPPHVKQRFSESVVDQCTKEAWNDLVRELYALDFAGGEPVEVPLEASAYAKIKDFINDNGAMIEQERDGNIRQMRSKMDGTVAKLALILHLVEHYNHAGAIIDSETTDRAIGLTNWFIHEATRIYRSKEAMTSVAAADEDAKVIEYIKTEKAVTGRDLMVKFRSKFKKSCEAKDFLGALAEAGLGRWQKTGQTNKFRYTAT